MKKSTENTRPAPRPVTATGEKSMRELNDLAYLR